MAEYQLYCFAQSGNSYRAALMLKLIGADWQPVFVDFFASGVQRTAGYRTDINEMGEAPVLVHGTKRLTQSGVILTYLAERSGKFQPRGEDDRLEALRWIIFDNQKVSGYLGPYRFLRTLAKPPGHPAVLEFFKGRIDNVLGILDKRLAGHAYVVGSEPTIADLSLVGYSTTRRRNSASTLQRTTRTSPPGSTASRHCPVGRIPTSLCPAIRCRNDLCCAAQGVSEGARPQGSVAWRYPVAT